MYWTSHNVSLCNSPEKGGDGTAWAKSGVLTAWIFSDPPETLAGINGAFFFFFSFLLDGLTLTLE